MTGTGRASGVEHQPPYRLLGALQATAGLLTLPFALLKLDPNSSHGAEGVLGALWLLLACATAFLAPRRGTRALDPSLYASSLLLAASAWITHRPQVQLVDGVAMILVGVFAGYTLPLPRLAGFLTFTVAVYTAALVHQQRSLNPWLAAVLIAMLVFNTLHVWLLVNRLKQVTLVDPLTGALNRSGLTVHAPAVRSVAQRADRPTTVVLIDLDDFKSINDQRGHAAGDRLLVDTVAAWSAQLRPGDLLARFGGDEFVLVLPGCDLMAVPGVLLRLRAASPCAWTSGASDWGADDPDVFTAIAEADREMYRGKRRRGNGSGGDRRRRRTSGTPRSHGS